MPPPKTSKQRAKHKATAAQEVRRKPAAADSGSASSPSTPAASTAANVHRDGNSPGEAARPQNTAAYGSTSSGESPGTSQSTPGRPKGSKTQNKASTPLQQESRKRTAAASKDAGSPGGTGGLKKDAATPFAAKNEEETLDVIGLVHIPTLLEQLVSKTACLACGGSWQAESSRFPQGSCTPLLKLVCTNCSADQELVTGQRVHMAGAASRPRRKKQQNSDAESDTDADEFTTPGAGRKRTRSKETTLWVLGTLFRGRTFADFKGLNNTLGMGNHLGEQSFQSMLYSIAPAVKKVLKRCVEVSRLCELRYGEYWDILTASDCFSGYHGHYSVHGTTTLMSVRHRLLLGFFHCTQSSDAGLQYKLLDGDNSADEDNDPLQDSSGEWWTKDSLSGYGKPSGSMDATGNDAVLRQFQAFIQDVAPSVMVDIDDGTGVAKHAGHVSDGDASIDEILANIDAGIKRVSCVNHLCKNAGGEIMTLAARYGKSCDCDPKLRVSDNTPYEDGSRHHTIPTTTKNQL